MSSEEACLARAILLSVSLAGTEGAVGKTEVTTKMDRWIDRYGRECLGSLLVVP